MQSAQHRTYAKPALSHDELITLYEERGLLVPDHDRAKRYLRRIGYYRLSPCTLPFQTSHQSHHFKKGTTFDDVLTLCIFDRELRLLVMDALERLEVAVRSALSDTMVETAPGKALGQRSRSPVP
ncbi:Abi family protein [Actinomyces lilanjuaniae]|uniref:Abi family protein n=1 Tax=Actinomyces lilanjuaniae TaxID=2321394 RepID=UPI001968B061|nr:Abi family protein [Actinomyces lilanjuaniae]